MRKTTIMAPLVAGLLYQPALAEVNQAWDLVQEAESRNDVTTWTRKVEGFTLKAFKGQTEVPYSMLTVLAVIADVERFPDWVFQCEAARLLPEVGDNVAYVRIKGIWPVSDRDVATETVVTQDPETLSIELSTTAGDNLYPVQDDAVRIPALQNTFTLEPLDDGWTRITFDTFVDPGGYIPGWLANLVAVRAPRDSLNDMYTLMQEPTYHVTESNQLPDYFPQWQTLEYPNRLKAPGIKDGDAE
ncbi:MAG: SRPBCC family protein [Alcanivoracaceae bacterium]|nr:SRPBCC family protein [Alcanivoracaceae bacterium]